MTVTVCLDLPLQVPDTRTGEEKGERLEEPSLALQKDILVNDKMNQYDKG